MDINIDTSGLDKLQKNLKNLKTEEVPVSELLNPNFMEKHTKAKDFEDFVLKSGLVDQGQPITPEVFKALPDEEWDKYISEQTSFSSWDDMLGKAGAERIKKKLFKGI
jgi:hypothetical protein